MENEKKPWVSDTGQLRKTTAFDDREPKNITINLHRAGVKVSQQTIQRRLLEPQDAKISSKNLKARLEFAKKNRAEPQKICSRD